MVLDWQAHMAHLHNIEYAGTPQNPQIIRRISTHHWLISDVAANGLHIIQEADW